MSTKREYLHLDQNVYYGVAVSAFAIVCQLSAQNTLDTPQYISMLLFAISIPLSFLSAQVMGVENAMVDSILTPNDKVSLFSTAAGTFVGGLSCIFFHFSTLIGMFFVICVIWGLLFSFKFNRRTMGR